MNLPLCVVLLSVFVRLLSFAASETAISFTVLDATDTPVANLTLTIHDHDGRTLTVVTNTDGTAVARQLVGPFFQIVAARRASGQSLALDATTLTDGLRLGVIVGEERSVLLRIDNNLLFVAPETIFSGGDTVPEPTPTAQIVALAERIVLDDAAPQVPETGSTSLVSGPLLGLLLLIGVPAFIWLMWWLRQVRIYRRQRRMQ